MLEKRRGHLDDILIFTTASTDFYSCFKNGGLESLGYLHAGYCFHSDREGIGTAI